MGGELLVETVERLEAGAAIRTPQDPAQVTYAPMLSKALSPVDWSRRAREIHDQIRGLIPWPGASTDALTGEPVKLWKSRVSDRTTGRPRDRAGGRAAGHRRGLRRGERADGSWSSRPRGAGGWRRGTTCGDTPLRELGVRN